MAKGRMSKRGKDDMRVGEIRHVVRHRIAKRIMKGERKSGRK